jgi:hypothetical protein
LTAPTEGLPNEAAVRQMIVHDLLDTALVAPIGRPAQRVAAVGQPRDVLRSMLGHPAVEQPAAQRCSGHQPKRVVGDFWGTGPCSAVHDRANCVGTDSPNPL